MRISILTLFPEMVQPIVTTSILKRAQEKEKVVIEIINIRDFAIDSYGTVDDRPYGGGAGMVLRVDVVKKAMNEAKKKSALSEKKTYTILTSARGTPYTQQKAQSYTAKEHLIIIAGHYEGVDERITHYVDEEISLGDFVMTGGEITAVAICDSVVRLLPGVLKKTDASREESFGAVPVDELTKYLKDNAAIQHLKNTDRASVQLLEYPHYTRPSEFEGHTVPEILTAGNHAAIRAWRMKQAYQITSERRPDLLDKKSSQ